MTRNSLTKIFSNIPELETERLVLRKIKISDSSDMYAYSCREEVTRWLLWSPHRSESYTARYISGLQNAYRSGEFFDWAVSLKSDRRMIGTCGFTSFDIDNNAAEIGYVLNPDFWYRGIAAEAASAVIDYGFEVLGLNRIEAHYMSENTKSRRVMEKCGMKFEGIFRSRLFVKGKYRDIGICSVLYSDWSADHPLTGNVVIRDGKSSRFRSWLNSL